MGPSHGVQSFRHRLLQRRSPMGSQVLPANLLQHGLPGGCSSAGSPQGHSFLQASTCSGVGFSTGCRWISAPPWTSMGWRGTACLTMVFSTGCRRISAPAPGAAPPPSSPLTLESSGLFLSRLLTPLSCCKCSYTGFFVLLKYLVPEALPQLSITLASSSSILEPAGTGCIGHGGSFCSFSQKPPPQPPHHYQNFAT